MELRRSLGLKRVPSAKETEGLFDLAMLEVRGMAKGRDMSSLLKPDGSRNMLHLELISWNSPPIIDGMSVRKGEKEKEAGYERF